MLYNLNIGISISSTSGVEMLNSKYATSNYINVDFINNEYYFISGISNRLKNFIAAYDDNKQFLKRNGASTTSNLLINSSDFRFGTSGSTQNPTASDIKYIRITQYEDSSLPGNINEVNALKIQLEKGQEATEWEPYFINKTISKSCY